MRSLKWASCVEHHSEESDQYVRRKSYRGTYSLEGDVVTVKHTSSGGVIRKMSMPTGGQKAIAVARTILRELV